MRTITITYSATVADIASNTAGTTRTNSAYYRWNLTDKGTTPTTVTTLDQVSNTATAATTLIEPALKVTKTVDHSPPAPGQTFSYTVTATNNNRAANLSPAYNYTVTDTIPVGIVVNPATITNAGTLTGQDADGSGGTITWGPIPGPLAANASTAFTYAATLAPSSTLTAAARTNRATITHYESRPAGGRNYTGPTATATITAQFPHITATKTAAPGPAYLGVAKTWTVTLTNDGSTAAHHVTATDTLPTNWAYVTGSATSSSPADRPHPANRPSASTALDTRPSTGPTWAPRPQPGRTPSSSPTPPSRPTPTPRPPPEPDPPSPTPTPSPPQHKTRPAPPATPQAPTTATQPPHRRTSTPPTSPSTKTAGDAVAGQNLTYTLAVANTGPDAAVGPFTRRRHPPTRPGHHLMVRNSWTCSIADTTMTCIRTNAADTLAPHSSFPPISIVAAVPADTADQTTITNTATVHAATYDPDTGNNTSQATSIISRHVDLAITKTTTGPVVAGADATYTLAIANNGPSDATGPITATDELPPGTNLVSATGQVWSCTQTANTVTCTRAAGLPHGQAAPR